MKAIFLDIETTGLDPTQHSVIDLAFKVIDLESGEIFVAYQSLVSQPKEIWKHADPASIEINGYQWEELQSGKKTEQIAQEVIALFSSLKISRGKSVFICQNPAFDRAFFTQIIPVYTQEKLNWPYHWLDLASMYWARLTLKMMKEKISIPDAMNLSKNSIAKEFDLPPEAKPHKAINGIEHLILCYRAVIGTNW